MCSATPTARTLYFSRLSDLDSDLAEEAFFSSIRLWNGTYKYTYARRLDDLNDLVISLLPAAGHRLRICDVAVSSGVSTLEWTINLEQHGIIHEMIAGDLTAHAYLLSMPNDLHVLVDRAGNSLQFDVRGEAIQSTPGRKAWAFNFYSLLLLQRTLRRHCRSLLMKCDAAGGVYSDQKGLTCRRIALVSPRLLKLPRIRVIEDDIFEAPRDKALYHVVRAANILNRSYFDNATLIRGVSNLRRRLLPGGLLITCRTNKEGQNNGTVFQLTESETFSSIARLNQGSEIEDLVLSL